MRHGVVYAMCHVVWFLESAVSASPPEGEGSGASKDAAGRGKVCGACEGVATPAPCCATCTRQHAPIPHTPLRRDLALILPVQHVHVNDWITVDVDRHQQSVVPCGGARQHMTGATQRAVVSAGSGSIRDWAHRAHICAGTELLDQAWISSSQASLRGALVMGVDWCDGSAARPGQWL